MANGMPDNINVGKHIHLESFCEKHHFWFTDSRYNHGFPVLCATRTGGLSEYRFAPERNPEWISECGEKLHEGNNRDYVRAYARTRPGGMWMTG
jgi:hypothetical protein